MFFYNKKKENKSNINIEENIPDEADKYDANWMKRMITHNVRMPMSIIRGYADVVRQDLLPEMERKKALDTICENIMYLDQILSVVFNDENTDEINLVKVNISEVITKVTGYMYEISKKNNIKIMLNIGASDVCIDAEYIPVMRVFYQIYENSFKYLKPYSTIEFKTYLAGEDILIIYKDDGEGVDSKYLTNIFEKGYRGDNSKGISGSGYGLYDVAQIVERYNGKIEIKSDKGSGFSIYITFPIAR